MQKRSYERIPAKIKVSFSCCETDYAGTITNLSENGMFISINEMKFPFDSRLELQFPVSRKIMKVSVKVSRMTKTKDNYDGIGVELLHPPPAYLDFIRRLKKPRRSSS